MSLEVDGRTRGISIPHQNDGEGFKFVNGQETFNNASHARESYITSTAEGYSQHQQSSKPEGSAQGGRERPRSILRWWLLSVLVAVLVVVPASVAGSIAAKRGKHFDGWYVFGLSVVRVTLTAGPHAVCKSSMISTQRSMPSTQRTPQTQPVKTPTPPPSSLHPTAPA